ncbi:unnamed protein product [Prorocentrum cordatum]|uniref:Uncharacterized protein n=1 Tax=Prorocentrum cordatum TaxID=2364126 RepID=A0ABN9SWS2_9DINO|nr:unnamed protein product [Polarella glacialis]
MSDTTPFFFFCVAHTSPPRRSPRPQEAAATREHRAGAESGRREATPAGPGRLRPRAHHGPKKPLPFATTEPKKRMVIRTTYVPRFAASRPRPPTGGGGVVVTGGPPKKCISTAGARWLVRRPAEAGEAAPTKVTTREPSDRAATTWPSLGRPFPVFFSVSCVVLRQMIEDAPRWFSPKEKCTRPSRCQARVTAD